MAQAAPQQIPAAAQPSRGGVAIGGPIADMQRTIAERMTIAEWQEGSLAPDETDMAHRLSRVAGPALLAAAYVGVALWWF